MEPFRVLLVTIDVSPDGLWDELNENEDYRDDFLGPDYDDKLARYAGPGWRYGGTTVDFENHSYEWLSLFLPLLASGNPRVRARTPRRGQAQALAKGTEFAVNRNILLTDFKALVEKLAVDFAFKWCVSITSSEPRPGYRDREDPPNRPVSYRISPTRFLQDYSALEESKVGFMAHQVVRSKKDILKEAEENPHLGWNVQQLSAMPEDRWRHDKYAKQKLSSRRGEIDFYELWVPDHRLDEAVGLDGEEFEPLESDGFHGTIFTMAKVGRGNGKKGSTLRYLREPRPFWGPRDGPYTHAGYMVVPDEVIPLSPIGAVEAQVEELNAQRRAISAAMERYASFIAIDAAGGEDAADKIRDVEDLEVAVFEGVDELEKHVRQLEKGGATPQQLTHYSLLMEALHRSAGMADSQVGQPTGGVTATAEAIASQGSGQRMGFMTEKFRTRVITKILQKEAWYIVNDDDYREVLGPEASGVFVDPDTGEPIEEVIYVGGGNSNILEEMDITVEPFSTRYTSEALEAERAMKRDNLLVQVANIPPHVGLSMDFNLWLEAKAEEFGDPSILKLFRADELRGLWGAMLTGQVAEPQGGASPQPRLAGDIQPQLKAAETSGGFSANARPQTRKGPRSTLESSETHSTMSASTRL